MKKQSLVIQIALIAGAVAAGFLLDRVIVSSRNPVVVRKAESAEPGKTPARSADAVSSQRKADSAASTGAPPPEASPPPESAASNASLDSILTQRDSRQRLHDLLAFINAIGPGGYGDALKRIRQITSSNERELASRLLIAQWAQADPDGALQFAAGNRGYEYVAEDVFQQFAASDFDSAMSRAEAIPLGEIRYRALRGVLSFKADTDPQGALRLAQKLGDFQGSEPLTSVVYRQWAANDPQAAASQATTEGQGEGWRSPVGSVVQTWAGQDPVAAANWSLGLEDAQAQERAISQVMRQWTRENPNAAVNWIYGLEPGPARDAAVAGLAQSMVARDPGTAISWIGTMTNDASRNRTLQRISGTVMWRDPQNGAALLQSAGLPADQIRNNRRGRGP